MITDMVTHDHEADALPQTQGYYRPSMGKVLVHAEKRGPAFDAANATARLMTGLVNRRFLEMVPAWTDLLAALHVTPSPCGIAQTTWAAMTKAVYAALLGANGETRDVLWAEADEQVRGYAKVAAGTWDKDAMKTQGGDDWTDVDMDRRNEIVAAYAAAAKLRAFAQGVR
jgi:hypothetical protein